MNKHFYLFGALALPLLMAGCSNDILDAEKQNQDLVNGNVVKIDKDFRLFAERTSGEEGSATRGEWINGANGTVYYWMPDGVVNQYAAPSTGTDHSKTQFTVALPVYNPTTPNLKFDEVGLCWLGAGEVGENIFTNYKFVHDGWLEDNQISMKDQIVDCDNLTGEYLRNWNWVKYVKDTDTYGASAADWAAENRNLTVTPGDGKVTGSVPAPGINAYDDGAWNIAKKKITSLNLSKGTFRTENKSIFTGKYLAYYPYDAAMVEEGRLIAKTATTQEAPIYYKDRMLKAGDYTFLAGYMAQEIQGGSSASALTMNPISGLMSIKQYASTIGTANIQHLVVMSAKSNITETMGLRADAIKAGNELDGATSTTTQKIIVDFVNNVGTVATLDYDNPLTADDAADTYNRVIIPMLPGTISDLDLMWVDDNYKAKITNSTLNKTINKASVTDVNLKGVAHTYSYYVAWDEASLTAALANAGAEAASTGNRQTVIIINKIVINASATIPAKVTVSGIWRGQKVGELVVAANNVAPAVTLTAENTAWIDCDLTIEGKGCCHKNAGILDAQGINYLAGAYADGKKNLLKNYGLVKFTSTIIPNDLRTNNIDGDFENTPLQYVVDGVTSVDPATDEEYQLPFDAEDFSEVTGGKYDFTNPDVFKGSVVAISTQATVNINSKFDNNTRNKGTDRKDALVILQKRDKTSFPNNNQDARLIVNPNAVLDNFATILNQGTVANNSGLASGIKNEIHATYINMIGGQLNGYKMAKAANSNFIAQVDNSIDSRYTTALNEHLANIIEFLPLNAEYSALTGDAQTLAMTYQMNNVNNPDLKYLINAGTEVVTLVGKKVGGATGVPATIGAIEVANGSKLNINFAKNAAAPSDLLGTTTPVNLNVTVDQYNTIHKEEAPYLVNKKYPVAIPAVKTDNNASTFNLNTNQKADITFTTVGDVEFNGVEFIGKDGNNLPIVTIDGDMTVNNKTTVDPMVINGTILGNLTINGTMNFMSDVKLKVGKDENTEKGHIQNNGTFNIESMTIINSPAIIYCKDYNLTGGTWLNGGRPTPFTAGGVVPGYYNW